MKRQVTLPVVIDSSGGRDMKISYIEAKIYSSHRVNKGVHLLSPPHVNKMVKLPF